MLHLGKKALICSTQKIQKLVFRTSFTSVSTSKFRSFRASKLQSKYFAVWKRRSVNKYVNECYNVHAVLNEHSEKTCEANPTGENSSFTFAV